MRNVFALALLVAFLAPSARADGPTDAEREEAYNLLCVPGSVYEDAADDRKLKEALEFRVAYQDFLRAPEARIEEFKRMKMFGGKENGGFGGAMLFGILCGMTDALHADISKRGCKGGKGEAVSADKAAALCAPLIQMIKDKN